MGRTFKANRRFYLLLFISIVLLVLFVVGAVYLLRKVTGNVRRLDMMTIYSEVESDAVVVRNERLITETASESRILLNEGALVQEGDAVAVLYPYSYESSLAEICNKELEVYTHLESLIRTASTGGVLPESIEQYNQTIEATAARMRQASIGKTRTSEYAAVEEQLIRLLEGRRNLMVSLLADPSMVAAELSELDTMKQNFETNSAKTIYSEYNGYVSFYSDANEENLRDVSQLTVPLVKRILNSPSISMDNENFYYRIVTDRSNWYLAFVISGTSEQRLMPGLSYSFTIKGVSGAYQGTIITEKDTASGVLYVMQIQADVRPLLTTRVVEISVQNNATGLYVPLDYVQYSDGVPYIYVKATDGSYQKIAVYIAGSDGENAIVSARDSTITLFAGLKVRIPPEQEDD
ncbi:MAG: hypothetical protein IJK88_08295 [Clostridia bacterium]|nr:hypothetical protein [Clostridia bacterium]